MNGKNETADIIGLLARLAVGGLLIYAGLMKALAPVEEFGYAIESYRVLDARFSLWAAYAVPWIELWTGLLLAGGVFTRLNAVLAGLMLLGFEAMLGQAWLRGLPITSCGCFGSGGGNSIAREFTQNLVFLALSWAAFKYGSAWSADKAVETL